MRVLGCVLCSRCRCTAPSQSWMRWTTRESLSRATARTTVSCGLDSRLRSPQVQTTKRTVLSCTSCSVWCRSCPNWTQRLCSARNGFVCRSGCIITMTEPLNFELPTFNRCLSRCLSRSSTHCEPVFSQTAARRPAIYHLPDICIRKLCRQGAQPRTHCAYDPNRAAAAAAAAAAMSCSARHPPLPAGRAGPLILPQILKERAGMRPSATGSRPTLFSPANMYRTPSTCIREAVHLAEIASRYLQS